MHQSLDALLIFISTRRLLTGSLCDRQVSFNMFLHHSLSLIIIFSGLNALSLSGCGSRASRDVATVQGTVLMDGQPVETGAVTFIPHSNVAGPSGGGKIVDGRYEIPAEQNLLEGEYKIEVTVVPQRPPGIEAPAPPTSATDLNAKPDKWAMANPVRHFKDLPHTPRLTIGQNTFDVELKSKK